MERHLSFKALSHGWALHVQYALSIVDTGYSGFFHNSLNPVIPFINVTETRTLRSSSLKPHMLWCTSPLSRKPGYIVGNLQRRSNQIENYLFERLETKNAVSKRKKGERNFPINWQMPINSAYRVNLFFTSSTFWEFVSARIMKFEF